jgi:hypothetical protein
MANKSQAPLPDDDGRRLERAQRGETINRDALLFFEGRNKVHACFVRDVTNEGPACD